MINETKVTQKIKKPDGSFVTVYPTTVVDNVMMTDKETTLLSYIDTLVQQINTMETELASCKKLLVEMQEKMVTWE